MIAKKHVLLLKSQSNEPDKYAEVLSANGYAVKQVKTLEFVFKNLEILFEEVRCPSNYSGFIFSSPRCVEAVSKSLKESESFEKFRGEWEKKENFAVGEATYRNALSELGLECKGKESGNAVNLAKIIVEKKELFDKPFLFPHGNLKTGVLNDELKKHNLQMHEVLVYDTLPNSSLADDLAGITNNYTEIPEYVVFFSPSGLNNTIEFLTKVPVDFQSLKFIAIGPVTEMAIKERNLPVHAVATSPTPTDILNAINRPTTS